MSKNDVILNTQSQENLVPVNKTPVIFVTNTKGGTGKTTTVTNLAAALAKLKKKVLIIDTDPQEHIEFYYGIDPKKNPKKNLVNAIMNNLKCQDVAIKSELFDSLYIIPSGRKIADRPKNYNVDKNSIDFLNSLSFEDYDVVLFDTTTVYDEISSAAIKRSNFYLVPTFPALENINYFINTIQKLEEVKNNLELDLLNLGLLFVKCNKKSPGEHSVVEKMKQECEKFQLPVCETIIPLSDKVSNGSVLIHANPTSDISKAYLDLANELLNKMENKENILPPNMALIKQAVSEYL